MELLIAILMFFGVVSPDAATSMSFEQQNMLVAQNQQLLQQTMSNPMQMQAVNSGGGFIIDRRED